jgi:hypothetical protein
MAYNDQQPVSEWPLGPKIEEEEKNLFETNLDDYMPSSKRQQMGFGNS